MEITGQILKENREKAGYSINEIAIATKINVKVIQAMESGDKSQLPALTFLRGFVRTYAKFLKLDEEAIMQTFYEEMGTSKPQKIKTNCEGKDEENPDSLIHTKSLTSRYFAVAGILALILLIISIRKVVDKYEKEAMLPPLEDIREIVQIPEEMEQSEDKTQEPEDTKSLSLTEQTVAEKENKKVEAPHLPSEEQEKLKQEVMAEIQANKQNLPLKEVPEKVTQTSIVENVKEVKKEDKKIATETPGELVKEPIKIALSPQELIIEALDNTQFSFIIDNKDNFKISLKPTEVHIIKANSSIVLNLSDGGAVSLTHNGQRRGVPGDLGRSMKLNFP
ncbi:MAG: helix-turn-helix domain-containing protein [Bdellovibrionales bacterium]|nr:helix-turn-helix domain-containing protein [Bdellovibrionales bacterium]